MASRRLMSMGEQLNKREQAEANIEGTKAATATSLQQLADRRIKLEEWKENTGIRKADQQLSLEKKAMEVENLEQDFEHRQADQVLDEQKTKAEIQIKEAEAANAAQKELLDNDVLMSEAEKNRKDHLKGTSGTGENKQGLMQARKLTNEMFEKIQTAEQQGRSIDSILQAVSADEVLDGRGAQLINTAAGWADFLGVSTFGYDLESNDAAGMRTKQLVFDMIMSNPRGITDADREFGIKVYGDLRQNKEAYIHNLKVIKSSMVVETMYNKYVGERANPDTLGRISVFEARKQFDELMGPNTNFTVTGINPATGTTEYFSEYMQKTKKAYPDATMEEVVKEWNKFYSHKSGYKRK
jgi:hypothetical protein